MVPNTAVPRLHQGRHLSIFIDIDDVFMSAKIENTREHNIKPKKHTNKQGADQKRGIWRSYSRRSTAIPTASIAGGGSVVIMRHYFVQNR